MKEKGLGDTIEKLTTITGIKKVVEKLEEIFNFDCHCDERKEKLNKLFPYKTECLNEKEYEYLSKFDFNINQLQPIQQNELLKIYNRVFNQQQQATSCGMCWIRIVNELKTLFEEYKK